MEEQKTDDVHLGDWENTQFRACPRGRAQQQHVFAAERVKYPMKRKHWQPGGKDFHGELRGIDEWERISWDEAIELCASEIKRVYEEYGPKSVYLNAYTYQSDFTYICAYYGGARTSNTSDSFGTWAFNSDALGTGTDGYCPDCGRANDRFDLPNADYIVLYGCNPAWASAGVRTSYFEHAKHEGVEFVYVGPSYNVSASALDAKWIRVRPGTDMAFMLAVCYVMLRDDESVDGGLIDWDFLDKYTVGFDMDHLPADATVQECFKDYILGEYDGEPKTPEWATEICGTPVEDIEWYAHMVGKNNKVMLLHSFAAARTHGAEDVPQVFMAIGCMGGHMGKSGHACGAAYHYEAGNAGPHLLNWGPYGHANPDVAYMPCSGMLGGAYAAKHMADGEGFNLGSNAFDWEAGLPGCGFKEEVDVKLFLSCVGNWLQSRPDVNDSIKAYRKAETVIYVNMTFDPTAQYSDIILPASTAWESNYPMLRGAYQVSGYHPKEFVLLPQKIIEPLYESKDDHEIMYLLVEALGLEWSEIYSRNAAEETLGMIKDGYIIAEDGITSEPLVAIDEEDLAAFQQVFGDATCETQEGRVHLSELIDSGFYQVDRHEGDNYTHIGYKDFIDDPVANPLPSNSGKFEIYCQAKADKYNLPNYEDYSTVVFKPYPTYYAPVSGYVASFSDWENKVKSEHPYVMYTPHYLRRSHTMFDMEPWLREAFANPIYINASDAAEKGIVDGDTVLVFNQHGRILRNATVLESIMPGCVALPHGAWPKIDPDTGIDYGGCENVLYGYIENPSPCLGAYNSIMVDFEKWTGDPLPPDYQTDAVRDLPEFE